MMGLILMFQCEGLTPAAAEVTDNDDYKRLAQLNLNGGREEGVLPQGQADNFDFNI